MRKVSKDKFKFYMYVKVQSLCDKIIEYFNVDYSKAREMLYASKLYNALEDESTKMWYFSSTYLFFMFRDEMETGVLKIYEG